MDQHKHNAETESTSLLYKPGTVVRSKADPAVRLVVLNCSRGIYYCAAIGNAQKNNLAFFECQLEIADSETESCVSMSGKN